MHIIITQLFALYSFEQNKNTGSSSLFIWGDLKQLLILHISTPKRTKIYLRKGQYQPADNRMCPAHDDVIILKHLSSYWPFVRGIHLPPVNSPHKGQWRGALMVAKEIRSCIFTPCRFTQETGRNLKPNTQKPISLITPMDLKMIDWKVLIFTFKWFSSKQFVFKMLVAGWQKPRVL